MAVVTLSVGYRSYQQRQVPFCCRGQRPTGKRIGRLRMRFVQCRAVLGLATLGFVVAGSAWALTPRARCEADKLKRTGALALCRLKADAQAVKAGGAADYSRCNAKFVAKWLAAEATAGGQCPVNGDLGAIQAGVGGATLALAAAIGGAPPPGDVSFPATGQITCWGDVGPIACAGTGQDGEMRAGTPLGYVDNGDGTITDLVTRLVWEKKSDDSSIHDKDATYSWSAAYSTFIAGLRTTAFAGHTDWRLPNVKELQSLVNYEVGAPALSLAFNTGCAPGCSVTTCSCAETFYWSSTTAQDDPSGAWLVSHVFGNTNSESKATLQLVRAVRGPD
jgi:hypothetical protein